MLEKIEVAACVMRWMKWNLHLSEVLPFLTEVSAKLAEDFANLTEDWT
ncbi:hypothetical protein HF078_04660 [Bacillus sp. RO2]|nr:hypothetical protein [Bacillus sp. RO2]NMH72356.1 hypothetical protein [Bacillus sp. RO2]